MSIAAEAFANTNSKHLEVMPERGLEACCMIVLSIMLAISPESAIRIRMWGEGIRVSVAWCRGVRGVGVVTRIVKSFK